jgi:hypothetical protein
MGGYSHWNAKIVYIGVLDCAGTLCYSIFHIGEEHIRFRHWIRRIRQNHLLLPWPIRINYSWCFSGMLLRYFNKSYLSNLGFWWSNSSVSRLIPQWLHRKSPEKGTLEILNSHCSRFYLWLSYYFLFASICRIFMLFIKCPRQGIFLTRRQLLTKK